MRPAGSKSVTTTPVALSGPLFETVTVKFIVSPTFGVALLAVLVMLRSACWGVVTELLLLEETEMLFESPE
ncbi:hypothetical protein D3C75_1180080 [compost metagenome]